MEQLSLLEASRRENPGARDDEHVALVADNLLQELDLRPPIPLEVVASYQGIGAIERGPLPHGGCLVTDPSTGRMLIRLRSSDHPRRQRFSGFHEVAHTFMPGYQLQLQWRCDPPLTDPSKLDLEGLCDIGASELLLPRRPFRTHLDQADFGMKTLMDLGDTFDASLQATGHRVVDLWPEDAMFVVATVQNKPADRNDPSAAPKLRINYAWRKGSWPFIRPFKSIDPQDPLARALQGEIVDETTTLTGISAHTVEGVHVSARLCPFHDAGGEFHARVLALYRKPGRCP